MERSPPDTIFAIASGAGVAGIAVLRLSGPLALQILGALAQKAPQPRRATLTRLADPATGEPLDHAIVLAFPGPASFTGEDYAEIHLHGSRAVTAHALRLLAAMPGARPAEPGEFALRAFRNGKMDLTAVEALGDLLAAETEAQRKQALRLMDGALGKQADAWRSQILEAQALTEAWIDFSDEEDVPATAIEQVSSLAKNLAAAMQTQLALGKSGEVIRDGFHVVIAGAPNVGKSSLLNALARRDAAIVSPHAGTTRDLIEVRLDLGGVPVILTDTAGIRDSRDEIELEGIQRGLGAARRADLALWLFEAGGDMNLAERARVETQCLDVATKSDLNGPDARGLGVSAKTGAGLEALIAAISAEAAQRLAGAEGALVSRQRHRLGIEETLKALTPVAAATASMPLELVAEDLRAAAAALARITGRIDVEDVLGAIFSRFCIGK